MKKCSNYKSYKGIRSPKCNRGQPCDSCRRLYYQKELARRILEDIRTDNVLIVKELKNE